LSGEEEEEEEEEYLTKYGGSCEKEI